MSTSLNNRIWWLHLKASIPIPSELFRSPSCSWSQKRSNLLPSTNRERNRMPLPAEGWSCLQSVNLSTSRSEYCQHHLGIQGPRAFITHMCLTHASVHAKLLQSCPALCDPMDHSPPGSSVHGILQARILEWVAISSSRGSS